NVTPYASEANILCKEIFKDPDVCRRALDWTITPTEHKRTESLSPSQLSNRMNVLTALLVGSLSELQSEISTLEKENERVEQDWSALDQDNKKLRDQLVEAKASTARSLDELARTDAKLSEQALVVRGLENDLAIEISKS
nr:hypothetical protein [Tanacetum cinerariifolium]